MSLINQCRSQQTKTPPEPNHQVQPDSVPPFIGGREGSTFDPPRFRHETRPDNTSDFQRDPKPRIKFPKSSDAKKWKELDQMLSDALPKIFSNRIECNPVKQSRTSIIGFMPFFFNIADPLLMTKSPPISQQSPSVTVA